MIILITGKPGVGKTNLTLTEFLAIKDRPKYAAGLNGFDYEANGVTEIKHFSEWVDCPDGSVIFIDEIQRDLRAQVKASDIPDWVAKLETHRWRGIDIYLTTQFPAFVHVHVRRLVEKHIHYHRTSGSPLIVRREWSSCCDDPNDQKNTSPQSGCTVSMVRLKKDTFAKYESTALDTHKFKLPPKLITYAALLSIVFGFVFYFGYPLVNKYFLDKPQQAAIIPEQQQIQPEVYKAAGHDQLEQDKKTLGIEDFTPVHPTMPYTAPYYANYAKPTDFPRFAGCMSVKNKCKCYTQQGTLLIVEDDICKTVIEDNAMPFNPFHQQEMQQYQPAYQVSSPAPVQPQVTQTAYVPEPVPQQQIQQPDDRTLFLNGSSLYSRKS